MIAARLAKLVREDTLKRGPDAPIGATEKTSKADAAGMVGIGLGSVDRAKAVLAPASSRSSICASAAGSP